MILKLVILYDQNLIYNMKITFEVKQFYFLFGLLLIISCQNKQQKAKITNAIAQKIIGQKLNFPDNLETYRPFKDYLLDSTEVAKKRLRIFTYINISCPSCIANLENWNKVASQLIKYNVPIFFLCYSEDNFEYIKFLCEQGKVKTFAFPFFFDKQDRFLKKNKFLTVSPNYHTVLLDENDKILWVGDPSHNPDMATQYLDLIKEYTNQ